MSETREQKLAREYGHSAFAPDSTVAAVTSGVKQWPLDAAVMAADIADLPYGALRAIATRLGQRGKRLDRELPPMGVLGAMARRGLTQPTPRAQTEMTELPPLTEDMARLANPANFVALGKSLPGLAALAGVVKPKGGNWLTGSVEDALSGLKRENPLTRRVAESVGLDEDAFLALPKEQRAAAARAVAGPDFALNSWIEGPLAKYVKTRMASTDDEVRKLAEQGVLHFEPQWGLTDRVADARKAAGFPVEGVSKSEPAIKWEAMADRAVLSEPAETYQNFGSSNLGLDWVNKLDPKTPFYRPKDQYISGDLGFPHLIDELSNALDPNSGLPRHLQLTPEAIKQMSMEKAVRRVAEINEWRAAQKIEANRKLAEQASLVREYAENNPKGLRWVELNKRTYDSLPEDMEVKIVRQGGYTVGNKSDDAEVIATSYPQDTPEAAIKYWLERYSKGRAAKELEGQLKYEGDTMGHCVGGYCDDVLSGRSRIFSLRDAKGEPHVTVEVEPPNLQNLNRVRLAHAVGEDRAAEIYDQFIRSGANDLDEFVTGMGEVGTPRIKQIKGKQNRAPNEEYLPFVQDFVRNSPLGTAWSDVGDLQNTGLRRTRDIWNELELSKIKEAGHEIGDFVSTEDKERIGRAVWGDAWGKYASGGAVVKKDLLDNSVNSPPLRTNTGYNSAGWNILGEAA